MLKREPVLHDFARRKPEMVVIAAFLWAPLVLIFAVAIPQILIPALLLAAAPYTAILVWALWSALNEAPILGKALLLIALAAIIAFSINWEAPPPY